MRLAALLIEGIRAVIADERIRHGDDLAAVRRIGQHFLVTGHRSVKTNFADARAGRAKRFAVENSAVFESENRAHSAECRCYKTIFKSFGPIEQPTVL